MLTTDVTRGRRDEGLSMSFSEHSVLLNGEHFMNGMA